MTTTDTQWADRLNAIMPSNFMDNISGSYAPVTSILSNMINRIGLTIINSPDTMVNPFGDWTRTVMDYGDTIQEYKVKVINPDEFTADDASADTYTPTLFDTVKNSPIAQYSTLNDKVKYRQTVFDNQLKLAFTSEAKFGDFTASMLASIKESDSLDKFLKWKKFMSREDIYGTNITLDGTDSTEYYNTLIRELKQIVTKFKFPSTDYNASGDTAVSSGVTIIMKASDKNAIDMDVLAGVYNMEKMDIDAKIKLVDDFATPDSGKEIGAIVVDDRFFSYYPRTPMAGAVYNPEDMYTNTFLNVQGTYTASLYRNAEIIYKE